MTNNLPPPAESQQGRVHLPKVSVIIPTKNVERFIEVCLASVARNDYPKELIEVIVVDNGSTDTTRDLSEKLATKVLLHPNVTISTLRNIGAAESSGEILAFLDADCLADRDWLKYGVQNVMEDECVAGSLYEIPIDAVWIERDWFCQKDAGRAETTHTGAGNLFISRKLFDLLNGFDETLVTGEDTEFCARARRLTRIISDDRIKAIHLGNPKTLYQFFRREVWYGLGAFGSFRVSRFDKPLLGTLAFAAFSLLQLLGILIAPFSRYGKEAVLTGCVGILSLLAATLYFRRRYIRDWLHALRLAGLYYIYYLGRTISLFYIIRRKDFYHNIKENSRNA